MKKLNKKRKGNVLIVTALILLIFPSVLLLANLGSNGVKMTKQNLDYHQEILVRESLGIILEQTITSVLLDDIEFEATRDEWKVGWVSYYSNYYVPMNTEIDLDSIFAKIVNRSGLYNQLNIETLVIVEVDYEKNITPEYNRETPFTHMLPIKCKMIVDREGNVRTYTASATVEFTVETNINIEKGYITEVEVTEINIVE